MIVWIILGVIVVIAFSYYWFHIRPFDNKALYDVNKFPQIVAAQKLYKQIAKEAKRIQKISSAKRPKEVWVNDPDAMKKFMDTAIRKNDEWIRVGDDSSEWYNYPLVLDDKVVPGKTKNLCPIALSYLKKLKGIKVAGFSRLNSKGKITPHEDETGQEIYLTYHLGLYGTSYLWCNGKGVSQHPGAQIIFDARHTHEAKNDSKDDRVVLYVLFKRSEHIV